LESESFREYIGQEALPSVRRFIKNGAASYGIETILMRSFNLLKPKTASALAILLYASGHVWKLEVDRRSHSSLWETLLNHQALLNIRFQIAPNGFQNGLTSAWKQKGGQTISWSAFSQCSASLQQRLIATTENNTFRNVWCDGHTLVCHSLHPYCSFFECSIFTMDNSIMQFVLDRSNADGTEGLDLNASCCAFDKRFRDTKQNLLNVLSAETWSSNTTKNIRLCLQKRNEIEHYKHNVESVLDGIITHVTNARMLCVSRMIVRYMLITTEKRTLC